VLAASLVRTAIPLAALGYPDGIVLDGGAVILRLPAYPGAQYLAVRFPVSVRGDPKGAQVRVAFNGREIAQLANEHLRDAVLRGDAAIPPHAQTLEIIVDARVLRCSDAPPPEIRIGEAGSVIVTQDPKVARSWRDSYAGSYTIIEPQHPDTAWRAQALASAYALHVLEGWRRVSVSLGATPAPGAQAVRDVAVAIPHRARPSGVQTFAQLGVAPLDQSGEDVDFVASFELGQLGGVPNRMVALLHLRASAPGRMDAFFNSREINALAIPAGAHDVRLPIATAALRGTNSLRLRMRFDNPRAFCAAAAPELALGGSELRWSGHGDVPLTLERRVSELSGNVVVQSDPEIFAEAFTAMSALGSVNRTIDAIDAQPPEAGAPAANVIRIERAPDVEAQGNDSYGEVHLEPNGAIRIAYVGDPSVLNRLQTFGGALASSDATRFEFGMTGAPITQGGPFSTNAQKRQKVRWIIYGSFVLILIVATWLIARRARRFS